MRVLVVMHTHTQLCNSPTRIYNFSSYEQRANLLYTGTPLNVSCSSAHPPLLGMRFRKQSQCQVKRMLKMIARYENIYENATRIEKHIERAPPRK